MVWVEDLQEGLSGGVLIARDSVKSDISSEASFFLKCNLVDE